MKHQFKPFDQVLVRDEDDEKWIANIFSHYTLNDGYPHRCIDNDYCQCIPYNEETAHLLNTTEAYHPEEPKEWEVRSSNGLFIEKYTSSELQNFINTAVINNKDITNFSITRIF